MDQRCGRRVMSPVDEAEAIYCGRYGPSGPPAQPCRPLLHFPPPPHHPPPRHNNNFSDQDFDLKESQHAYNNHHQSPCIDHLDDDRHGDDEEEDCHGYNHRNYLRDDPILCDRRLFERNHFATSSRHGHVKCYSDDVQKSKTFGHHRHHHLHTSSEPAQDTRLCQSYINDDHILTTAEVHNYPPKDGGSPKECNHKSYSSKKYQSKNSQKYPDDGDKILSLDERCAKDLDEILPARFAALSASQRDGVQWNRDNIAATMERFEPGDYSYAYYEPGVSSRRLSSSAPGSSRSNNCCQKTPTNIPKSLIPKDRALRHTYLTRYGTEENIYEEITEGSRNACPKHRTAHQQSLISLNQSIVEEEVRRVENRHKRILGELNLSVEAMLMPESESPDSEKAEGGDNLEELLRVGPTDELLSPASCHPPDLDSGFSGSSSGASYVGSLRYKPRGSLSLPRASPPAVIYGSGRGVKILDHKDNRTNECNTQCSRKVDNAILSSKSQNSVGNEANGGQKTGGFWSKKAWKKIPGFSSSNSINKAGLSGECLNLDY